MDLLKETGLLGGKLVYTLVEANAKLGPCKDEEMIDNGRYQKLIGKLIYLSHTRPDIAYAVSLVSQFMHYSRKEDLDAVYRILRYLKSCLGKRVLYSKENGLGVEIYIDLDWAGSVIDRRSTTCYCKYLRGNLIS